MQKTARDEIIAMAVAIAAQELGETVDKIRVLSFSEVKASALARYIEENNITYTKYQLYQ